MVLLLRSFCQGRTHLPSLSLNGLCCRIASTLPLESEDCINLCLVSFCR